jgi:hypothetical protein
MAAIAKEHGFPVVALTSVEDVLASRSPVDRLSDRLGQGALLRAAAHRVRPHPVDQTQGVFLTKDLGPR